MIELVEGLPANVLGVVVKGRVTRRDLTETLMPALDRAREWHYRLRLYYEIRSRYPGAAWEDTALGLAQGLLWERVALVCDVAWIRHTVQALRLVIPGEIRIFAGNQTPEALDWIAARPPKRQSVPASRTAGRTGGSNLVLTPARQFLHEAS